MPQTRRRDVRALGLCDSTPHHLHFSPGYVASLGVLTRVIPMSRVAPKTERGPQQGEPVMTRKKRTFQRGSVQEHPKHSGIWTLRYREVDHRSGRWKTRRVSLGEMPNKTAARNAALPIMNQVNERNNSKPTLKKPVSPSETFEQFVEGKWRAYAAKYEPSTRDSFDSLIRTHLMPYFGDKILSQITSSDVTDWIESRRSKVSVSTLQILYSLLRMIFSLAKEYELLETVPIKPKLHRPSGSPAEKSTLKADQIKATLAALESEQDRIVILLLAVTGMRVGEALALRRMDFRPEQSELSINHTLYRGNLKPPKTRGSKRVLRLAFGIAELLAAHMARSTFKSPTDFLFSLSDGKPLSPHALRKRLQAAMDRAGIERSVRHHGFHIFRHTAGSLIYARSRDLKLVQSTLGHSDISITADVYVHLTDRVAAEGTEIMMDEIFGICDHNCDHESEMVS